MTSLTRVVTLIALVLSLAQGLSAQVRIILPEIDGLVSTDGTGLYQRVLAEAANRAGLRYTAEVFPKKRALLMFQEDSTWDGIFTFTATVRALYPDQTILASYPFGAYLGYIFTPKGSKALSNAGELKGLVVGGLRGFEGTWPQFTQAGLSFELVDSDFQNLGKLRAGRIQAFLGFLPDLQAALPELNYNPARPFFQSHDRLTGRDTTAMRTFLQRLDPVLRAMHQDGTIKRIMGTAYLPITGDFRLDN